MKQNNEIQQFLEGGSFPENNQNKKEQNDTDDFAVVYKKMIHQSQSEPVPDFDAFEKITLYRKNRKLTLKRVVGYAASILLIISFFIFTPTKNPKPINNTLSDEKILEIQQNTELALLYFSKEFNACMANFENAKRMQRPISEMKSLKNYEIKFDNPIKNLKIQQ